MNPLRGETRFEAAGRTFTLVFDLNALCAAEAELGQTVAEIGDALTGAPSARMLRGLLWAALRRHHPDVALDEAGALCGVQEAATALGAALAAAFGEDEGDPAGNGAAAATGTG